jgi:hypothetical protein
MPKREIDYSTRMVYFYKFVKIDEPNFIDCYVGHTVDIIKRKSGHKNTCNNPNHKYYNLKIYKTIRENGGWDNWKMLVIHQQICKDDIQARQIEQNFIEELGAKMNTLKAYISKEQLKEYKKEWCENNKEKYKEYHEKYKEQQKEYRENNKEKIKEYHKEFYENNKEQILENKKKQKMNCECGSIFRTSDKLKHYKTLKHQAYCLSLNELK